MLRTKASGRRRRRATAGRSGTADSCSANALVSSVAWHMVPRKRPLLVIRCREGWSLARAIENSTAIIQKWGFSPLIGIVDYLFGIVDYLV